MEYETYRKKNDFQTPVQILELTYFGTQLRTPGLSALICTIDYWLSKSDGPRSFGIREVAAQM